MGELSPNVCHLVASVREKFLLHPLALIPHQLLLAAGGENWSWGHENGGTDPTSHHLEHLEKQAVHLARAAQ